MKRIFVKITLETDKRIETMAFEKHGEDDEINVLASGIGTIFLRSKEALKISEKKGSYTLRPGKTRRPARRGV